MAAQRQAAAVPASGAPSTAKYDCYLGLLYPIDELRVYGYLTNCRIKLIAVLTFLLVTSPISGHAVTRAAWRSGLEPVTADKEDSRDR